MTLESGTRLVDGGVVLLSVAFSHPKCPLFVSENFLFVTAAMGLLIVVGVLTGIDPTAYALRKAGLKGAGT